MSAFDNAMSNALSGIIARAEARLTPTQRANLGEFSLFEDATSLAQAAASLNPAVENVRTVFLFIHPDGSGSLGTEAPSTER
jgi:hypothetical protein